MTNRDEVRSRLELDEERVDFPGERDRECRAWNRDEGIPLPRQALQQIQALSQRLNAAN